jgi:hypothetical protein
MIRAATIVWGAALVLAALGHSQPAAAGVVVGVSVGLPGVVVAAPPVAVVPAAPVPYYGYPYYVPGYAYPGYAAWNPYWHERWARGRHRHHGHHR